MEVILAVASVDVAINCISACCGWITMLDSLDLKWRAVQIAFSTSGLYSV